MINYDRKTFKTIQNAPNGETSGATIFEYRQSGNILTATYMGGRIQYGQLLGLVDEQGAIDLRYHQVNQEGHLMTGICHSVPEILPNGKIRLHESWRWTAGDFSEGQSIVEEL